MEVVYSLGKDTIHVRNVLWYPDLDESVPTVTSCVTLEKSLNPLRCSILISHRGIQQWPCHTAVQRERNNGMRGIMNVEDSVPPDRKAQINDMTE